MNRSIGGPIYSKVFTFFPSLDPKKRIYIYIYIYIMPVKDKRPSFYFISLCVCVYIYIYISSIIDVEHYLIILQNFVCH